MDKERFRIHLKTELGILPIRVSRLGEEFHTRKDAVRVVGAACTFGIGVLGIEAFEMCSEDKIMPRSDLIADYSMNKIISSMPREKWRIYSQSCALDFLMHAQDDLIFSLVLENW